MRRSTACMVSNALPAGASLLLPPWRLTWQCFWSSKSSREYGGTRLLRRTTNIAESETRLDKPTRIPRTPLLLRRQTRQTAKSETRPVKPNRMTRTDQEKHVKLSHKHSSQPDLPKTFSLNASVAKKSSGLWLPWKTEYCT